MASGNTYQCINILKVSTSQLTNSSNHAPLPEQRHGNEKQGTGAGGGAGAGAGAGADCSPPLLSQQH